MKNEFKELAFELLKIPTFDIDNYGDSFTFRWKNKPYYYQIEYQGSEKTLLLTMSNEGDFFNAITKEISVTNKEDLQIRSIFVSLQEAFENDTVSKLKTFIRVNGSEIDKLLDDSADE